MDVFQIDRTFDSSAAFKFSLFQASDILWIPDHHWTQATVEKVAVVLAQFLLFIPKPNPFVSSSAKKTLSSKNSFLSFWPKCACVARNRDEATAEPPWRRNENKRPLKAMNHARHHQREGWCGSLLSLHKPLGSDGGGERWFIRTQIRTHAWYCSRPCAPTWKTHTPPPQL